VGRDQDFRTGALWIVSFIFALVPSVEIAGRSEIGQLSAIVDLNDNHTDSLITTHFLLEVETVKSAKRGKWKDYIVSSVRVSSKYRECVLCQELIRLFQAFR